MMHWVVEPIYPGESTPWSARPDSGELAMTRFLITCGLLPSGGSLLIQIGSPFRRPCIRQIRFVRASAEGLHLNGWFAPFQ